MIGDSSTDGMITRTKKSWEWEQRISEEELSDILVRHLRDNGRPVPVGCDLRIHIHGNIIRNPTTDEGRTRRIHIRANGVGDPPEMSATEPPTGAWTAGKMRLRKIYAMIETAIACLAIVGGYLFVAVLIVAMCRMLS